MYTFQSSGHFNFTTEMDSSNSLVLNFAFPCGLRGFHVYKDLWVPKLNEKLETIHEENNPHDRYAVAAIRKTVSRLRPVVVGHLPREISRFTRFIILHGATVKVKVSDTKYRRSPLIQGGLEIPVEVESATATKFFEFVVFAFSESLSGTYLPVRAVLSNKRGKMDFFTVFPETFLAAIINSCSCNPIRPCCFVTSFT